MKVGDKFYKAYISPKHKKICLETVEIIEVEKTIFDTTYVKVFTGKNRLQSVHHKFNVIRFNKTYSPTEQAAFTRLSEKVKRQLSTAEKQYNLVKNRHKDLMTAIELKTYKKTGIDNERVDQSRI